MAERHSTIDCMYSCNLCGITKAHVAVPVRLDGEDVAYWVVKIAAATLSEDHHRRSPDCHPATLSEVYIPMTGADYIGGPAKQ